MILSNIVLAVILSLSQSSPGVQITIDDGVINDDVAQTSRYSGHSYEQTTACKIVVDRKNLQGATERLRSRSIRLSGAKFYDFIVLHEMAHCFDGQAAPLGVDAIEWREFLADVYAASELVASEAITMSEYRYLMRFRDGLPDAYANNALREAQQVISAGGYGSTPEARIAFVKQLRAQVFQRRASRSTS